MNATIDKILNRTYHNQNDLPYHIPLLADYGKKLISKYLDEVDHTLLNDKTLSDYQKNLTIQFKAELEANLAYLQEDYSITDISIKYVQDAIKNIKKSYDKWSLDIINLPNSFANVAISAMSKNNVAPASGGKKKTKPKKKASKKRSPSKKKISRKASKKKTSPKRKSSKKKKR